MAKVLDAFRTWPRCCICNEYLYLDVIKYPSEMISHGGWIDELDRMPYWDGDDLDEAVYFCTDICKFTWAYDQMFKRKEFDQGMVSGVVELRDG